MSESLSALFLQNPELAIALRNRQRAQPIIDEGMSSAPTQGGWGIANRVAKALLGNYQAYQEDAKLQGIVDRNRTEKSDFQQAMAAALTQMYGGQGQQPDGAPAAPAAPMSAPMSGAPSQGNADFIATNLPHAMEAARQTGMDPRVILAQSALETGYGKSAPGNNFFGIKGPGQNLPTQESINGQMVPTQASFRAYGSPQESFQDYAKFLRENPRYAPVLAAQGMDAQIDALGRSGYATDPQYAQKVRMIARGIQVPTQIASTTMPGTATDAPAGVLPPAQQEPQPGAPQMAQAAPGGVAGMPRGPGNRPAPYMLQLYLRGVNSDNPDIQRQARALEPFLKMDQVAPVFNEIPLGNDRMQKVVSYDRGATWQPVGVAYDPRGSDRDLVTVPQRDGTVRYVPRSEAAGMVGADPRGPDRDLIEVRRADGSTIFVPRSQASGIESARQPPPGYNPGPNGTQTIIPGGPADELITVSQRDAQGNVIEYKVPRSQWQGGAAAGTTGAPAQPGSVAGSASAPAAPPGAMVTRTEAAPALTNPAMTDLERDAKNIAGGLSTITQIRQNWDPSFLTMTGQGGATGRRWVEWATGYLPPGQKEQLAKYTEFTTNTLKQLNQHIHDITGASMGPQEAARLTREMPNPQDSPTEFMTKLGIVERALAAARQRNYELSQSGIRNPPPAGASGGATQPRLRWNLEKGAWE